MVVADACVVGLLGGVTRLAERVDALLGEQRDQLHEYVGSDHRVAKRRVAAEHGNVESFGDRLDLVRLLLRVNERRQQQGVEHRLVVTEVSSAVSGPA